jgi:hypothetical protein
MQTTKLEEMMANGFWGVVSVGVAEPMNHGLWLYEPPQRIGNQYT